MSQYRVEALEKFVVRTVYHVEAIDPAAAETLCKSGKSAYDDQTIEEGDEEWLETVSVEGCGSGNVGAEICDCELPGYFCSGVPGILAQMEDGKLASDAKVERCDLCQRYSSDEAAARKLIEVTAEVVAAKADDLDESDFECPCARCGEPISDPLDAESTPSGSMHKQCAVKYENQKPEDW